MMRNGQLASATTTPATRTPTTTTPTTTPSAAISALHATCCRLAALSLLHSSQRCPKDGERCIPTCCMNVALRVPCCMAVAVHVRRANARLWKTRQQKPIETKPYGNSKHETSKCPQDEKYSYLQVPEPEYRKMMTEDKAVTRFLKPYVHPNATVLQEPQR